MIKTYADVITGTPVASMLIYCFKVSKNSIILLILTSGGGKLYKMYFQKKYEVNECKDVM